MAMPAKSQMLRNSEIGWDWAGDTTTCVSTGMIRDFSVAHRRGRFGDRELQAKRPALITLSRVLFYICIK